MRSDELWLLAFKGCVLDEEDEELGREGALCVEDLEKLERDDRELDCNDEEEVDWDTKPDGGADP